MVEHEDLMAAVVFLPLLASIVTLLAGADLSERHHIHHDTYGVSLVVSRTLVLVMVFMGVLGGLVGWLCHIGVFNSDSLVPLAFFAAFELTLLVMLIAVVRYQVMVYDDHLTVRPAFGRTNTIAYDDIDNMEWRPSYLGPNLRDLLIRAGDGNTLRIWSLLDIEQMLLRIDRFDMLRDDE